MLSADTVFKSPVFTTYKAGPTEEPCIMLAELEPSGVALCTDLTPFSMSNLNMTAWRSRLRVHPAAKIRATPMYTFIKTAVLGGPHLGVWGSSLRL